MFVFLSLVGGEIMAGVADWCSVWEVIVRISVGTLGSGNMFGTVAMMGALLRDVSCGVTLLLSMTVGIFCLEKGGAVLVTSVLNAKPNT